METKMQGRPTDLRLHEEDTDFSEMFKSDDAKTLREMLVPELKQPPTKYIYKNWKGKIGVRTIIPLDISYGSNEYHTTPTYLLRAWDLDKKAIRTFDMSELIPYKDEITSELIKEGINNSPEAIANHKKLVDSKDESSELAPFSMDMSLDEKILRNKYLKR